MKNIVIFGAPGSGKGTYSAKLVERYGLGHISTGDVLRGEIKAETELGKIAKTYIDEGKLIPDSLIIDMLASKLDGFAGQKGVIYDGFPRTIAQADAFKVMLEERGMKIDAMIELVVGEDVLMERLLRRAQIEGRADDNEETIKKRFVEYHAKTQPLSEWFAKEGVRQQFTWPGDMDEMLAGIYAAMDETMK